LDVGLYGKLPSHGDFLRRRVDDAFVDRWDGWLQRCMDASRAALGDRWLDVYLTSPAWRFACAPGACGPSPVVGLMVPSVDRVGRYFPLTLVAELPEAVSPIAAATAAGAFFSSGERLVVDTLAADRINFEEFDARVAALRDALGPLAVPRSVVLAETSAAIVNDGVSACWQVPIGSPDLLSSVFEQLFSLRLSAMYDPLALWWTEGSAMVEPSCLITKGLPHPDMFAAFLDGSWNEHRWWSVSAAIDPAIEKPEDEPSPLRFRSAARTDVGKRREVNQDAFLERSEAGLWAVADGLGGHREGEVASRMVCDALADFEPNTSFDDMIDGARQRIFDVNEHLLRASLRAPLPERSGSTVVTLLVRGTSSAILWAGDSRVYRWRSGRLERLTHDHSVAESDKRAGRHESHLVTRAVGIESKLSLDLHRDIVRAGDRFLLCSDGLTHTLSDAQIEAWMDNRDLQVVVEGLISATLEAGAPDNVTVVVVEADG
jgi:type VI secretion system ImpM family protein